MPLNELIYMLFKDVLLIVFPFLSIFIKLSLQRKDYSLWMHSEGIVKVPVICALLAQFLFLL